MVAAGPTYAWHSRAYLCMAQPGLRRMVAALGLFVLVPEFSFLDAAVPVFTVILRLHGCGSGTVISGVSILNFSNTNRPHLFMRCMILSSMKLRSSASRNMQVR